MKEEKEFYSVEVCYLGLIDKELDLELIDSIPQMVNELSKERISASWYFQESDSYHRLMGFELSKPLTYDDRIALHLMLKQGYDGDVFIISY